MQAICNKLQAITNAEYGEAMRITEQVLTCLKTKIICYQRKNRL